MSKTEEYNSNTKIDIELIIPSSLLVSITLRLQLMYKLTLYNTSGIQVL
jgi:hypothetical protein